VSLAVFIFSEESSLFFTGVSVSCCSLGLFYPKLKELVLKQVPLKS